jgi:hypothetical protein
MTDYPRLDWTPGWRLMNDNLLELVDLLPDDRLDWVPRDGEWPAPLIFTHLILARYHGPIMTPEDMARIGQVPISCKTKDGIKEELRKSWAMLERFLSDPAKLDATYENTDTGAFYKGDPEEYTGHYIAYHRFAHDLHHRSTVVGYLAQFGVPLDGHRLRPL